MDEQVELLNYSMKCMRGVVCNVVTYNMLADGFCQERRDWEVDGSNGKRWYKSKVNYI